MTGGIPTLIEQDRLDFGCKLRRRLSLQTAERFDVGLHKSLQGLPDGRGSVHWGQVGPYGICQTLKQTSCFLVLGITFKTFSEFIAGFIVEPV